MSASISIALGAPSPRRASPAARVLARLWAHGLDGRLAERPELRRFGSAPVQRYQVIDAAGLMRRLIALLRGPQAVSPRGVAIARLLLVDGTTPLYARAPRGAVARAVRQALAHAAPRFLRESG